MAPKSKLNPPHWLGRPILDDSHATDLETRAAINEFHARMPRAEAEQKAHDDYVREHRERAAAHHLAGMKAAQAVGNHEDARKHWVLYDMHLKALGKESIGSIPPEVEKRMSDENERPVYKFKSHKGDAYVFHEPSKDVVPVPNASLEKANKPQDVNEVLADQLMDQGFKPDKGYVSKRGLGTPRNAVKLADPQAGLLPRKPTDEGPVGYIRRVQGGSPERAGRIEDALTERTAVGRDAGRQYEPSDPNHAKWVDTPRAPIDEEEYWGAVGRESTPGTKIPWHNHELAHGHGIAEPDKALWKERSPLLRRLHGALSERHVNQSAADHQAEQAEERRFREANAAATAAGKAGVPVEKAEPDLTKGEAKRCKWRLGERRCMRKVSGDYCHSHVDHWANKIQQKAPKELEKANPPQDVNMVLADQLMDQGFQPSKGYSSKKGLGTPRNTVELAKPQGGLPPRKPITESKMDYVYRIDNEGAPQYDAVAEAASDEGPEPSSYLDAQWHPGSTTFNRASEQEYWGDVDRASTAASRSPILKRTRGLKKANPPQDVNMVLADQLMEEHGFKPGPGHLQSPAHPQKFTHSAISIPKGHVRGKTAGTASDVFTTGESGALADESNRNRLAAMGLEGPQEPFGHRSGAHWHSMDPDDLVEGNYPINNQPAKSAATPDSRWDSDKESHDAAAAAFWGDVDQASTVAAGRSPLLKRTRGKGLKKALPPSGTAQLQAPAAPQLHSTVEGFMGGLKALPKGSPARGKFITQHMNHAPFVQALQQHPQGKQIHSMLTTHLNSTANAGFKPGATQAIVKANPPQDVNMVLADQLMDQGFEPGPGHLQTTPIDTKRLKTVDPLSLGLDVTARHFPEHDNEDPDFISPEARVSLHNTDQAHLSRDPRDHRAEGGTPVFVDAGDTVGAKQADAFGSEMNKEVGLRSPVLKRTRGKKKQVGPTPDRQWFIRKAVIPFPGNPNPKQDLGKPAEQAGYIRPEGSFSRGRGWKTTPDWPVDVNKRPLPPHDPQVAAMKAKRAAAAEEPKVPKSWDNAVQETIRVGPKRAESPVLKRTKNKVVSIQPKLDAKRAKEDLEVAGDLDAPRTVGYQHLPPDPQGLENYITRALREPRFKQEYMKRNKLTEEGLRQKHPQYAKEFDERARDERVTAGRRRGIGEVRDGEAPVATEPKHVPKTKGKNKAKVLPLKKK